MAFAAFALWLAYGIWQWRRSMQLYDKLADIPVRKRTVNATLLLLGSGVALVAVFYFIQQASPKVIPPWGWAVLIVAGLGFVHAQTLAAAMIISTALRKPDR